VLFGNARWLGDPKIMNELKCPHCGAAVGNVIYAFACPHCHKLVEPTLSSGKADRRNEPTWLGNILKQAWSFPQSVAAAVKRMRRRSVLNKLEAERLDRIRNPSKYAGR